MAKRNKDIFRSRTPISSYEIEKMIDYNIPRSVEGVEKSIDMIFEKLKKQGMDIISIRLYLEGYVGEYVSKLIKDIDRQHYSHQNNIKRLFVRRKSDKKEFEDLSKRIDEQIDLVSVDYAYLATLYKNEKDRQQQIEKIIKTDVFEEDVDFENI